MKKFYYVFAVLLLFTVGCASSYRELTKNVDAFSNYTTVTMDPIVSDSFWDKNPGLKSDQKWQYQVNRAADYIQKKVNSFYNAKNTGGGKELKIDSELFMFNPGLKAARYFVGFGAGKGAIGYHVKLIDVETSEVLSVFDAFGSVAMGMFGGDIGTSFDQCAGAIIKYIEANR